MRRFRVVLEFELIDKNATVADAATIIGSAIAESYAASNEGSQERLFRLEIVEARALPEHG